MPLRARSLIRAYGVGCVVLLALTAAAMAPPAASAATTCQWAGAVLDVTLPLNGDSATVQVGAGGVSLIQVMQDGADRCQGLAPTPTVNSADAISIHSDPGVTDADVSVVEAQEFVPGKTDEPGDNEIEIFVNLRNDAASELAIGAVSTGASVRFGTAGVNTNATATEMVPDVDITLTDVLTLSGTGGTGSDRLSAQGGPAAGAQLSSDISLAGGSGLDEIQGGAGSDHLSGGGSDDVLLGHDGNDVLDGGSGADTVAYTGNMAGGVTVDLAIAGPQDTGGGMDSFSSVENLVGTASADVLRGDGGPNALLSLEGNDVLDGRGGVDVLEAGAGDDSLEVRDGGPDTADCGTEADTVTADSPGTDTLSSCENVRFPPEPSNEFGFGKVKKNKRKGTAKLTVIVPGAGEIDLAKTKKVKPQEERAEGEGDVKLAIKPRRRTKQRLREEGKAKVKAKVTYTPDGGDANTQTKKVKLVKR